MNEGLSFGQWLKQRRKAFDLTQEDLAKRIGCSLQTIVKIEAGERKPSKQIAERLAECLTVPADERLAFVQFAMKMSILCPFTLLPVSITVYTPAAGPSTMRTTEPIGSTRGSAERMPVCALRPDSVRPFWQ